MLSRVRRKELSRNRKRKPDVKGELDVSKEGEVPMASSPSSGGGGSVFKGIDVVTEGQFLTAPGLTFVDSPFGQKYLSRKTRALSVDDIVLRVQNWAFDVRGYWDYGTVTLDIPDLTAGELLLQDWYTLVRDMGKRSLKYKHLPLTLTDNNMLRYYLNTYFYVAANLCMLQNLNRLGMVNRGFAEVCQNLSIIMSRVTRLWRRLSAVPAPNFLKFHAIKCGMIPWYPNVSAPVIRVWANHTGLLSGSGGPTGQAAITNPVETALTNAANMATLITDLEIAERWIEVGTTTIATDFTALKDLIDMTAEVVPGSFSTGLPDGAKLPGLVQDKALLTDIFARALLCKADQATDIWSIFPIPQESVFGGRIPVAGFGTPGLDDFTLLGAPKYGHLNSLTARTANVDTIFRACGTDIPLPCSNGQWMSTNAAAKDARGIFGDAADWEQMLRDGSSTVINVNNLVDWNTASSIRGWLETDGSQSNHIWARYPANIQDSFIAHVWDRFVDEAKFDWMAWMEAQDLGLNYATYLAQCFGIPYIRS